MTRRAVTRRAVLVCAVCIAVLGWALQPAQASSKSPWEPNTSTFWGTGAGGDNYRTGYAPSERPPAFINGSKGTNGPNGPWLQWQTKIADLPSGVFPGAAIAVAYGLVYVSGGSTNSFLALDENTGLPVWRFQPDNRVAGYTAQYPATNAPVVHDGIVYMSFSNGFVYALDAHTGRKIWSAETNDFYKGPLSVGGSLPPDPYATGPCAPNCTIQNDPERQIGTGPFDPIHPPVQYSKIHGVTSYCDGKIFVETLAGYMHGYDAMTGRPLFKPVYVDSPIFPGELTWYEYPVGGALNPDNASNGSSTRRFEAVAGLGCVHHEILVLGSDGHFRWYDPNTGKQLPGALGDYNRKETNIGQPGTTDFCQQAGYNCDAAIGQADPVSGDYFITTLDSRMIRINWQTHRPEWKRSYSAPLPFQVGNTLPLSLSHTEVGFVTEAVAGSPSAEDVKNQILYVPDQDGHIYALSMTKRGGGLRPKDPMGPTLLSVTGISPNNDPVTPFTPKGEGGPWDYNQQALAGPVLGGNVLYVSTWDNRMTAFRVDDPTNPTHLTKIWSYQVTTDPNFQYPPFGDTFGNTYFPQNDGQPFTDLDNKIFSTPALLNGHLFFAANDGTVYCFDLMHPEKTVRNLAILGQGLVPFLPKWTQPVGAFDRVWTPADWYKNQVAPAGWRLPKPAGVATAAGFAWMSAALWWWMRRRDDVLEPDELDDAARGGP